MEKSTIDISAQEELLLVSQGIDTLLAESVEHRRGDILQILMQYPSLKKERFSDANFQQTIFDAYKKHFDVSVDYHLGYQYHVIQEYCKQFPFLTKMTLNDKDAQEKLRAFAVHAVQGLANSSSYGDRECTEYANDRMSSLSACEAIYDSPFVSKEIKQSNILGLEKALYHRYSSRHDGPRLAKVHAFVKKAGVSDHKIGQAMRSARWHGNRSGFGWQMMCDPKLLEYPEFPKEELKTQEAKEKIRGLLESHISEGHREEVAIFIAAYPFLKKKLKAIAEKIKSKKEEEQYDEETRRLLHFVAEGMKKKLGRLDSETAEGIQKDFVDIMSGIPREKIMEGVYAGLKETHTHESIITKKKNLLSKFPISDEEAGQALKNSMSYYDERQGALKYFPGHDFSKTYAEPEVKEKLFGRLLNETFPRNEFRYNENKVKKLLETINATQEELEQRYREHIVAEIQKQMNGNENLRSRNLPHKLINLRNLCSDKKKYKQDIHKEEIKALVRKYAHLKICDSEFSESFYHDISIKELCAYEAFPLTPEEIDKEVMAVFMCSCKGGSVPYRNTNYACIKKNIDEKNPELVAASMQGFLKLLDPSKYDRDHNIDHRFVLISLFVRSLPFLKDERKNEKVQTALVALKKHFLTQGRIIQIPKIQKLIDECS